ncbi:DUF6896 domain-containing protein [Burkholderia ubonensis]|uniref:DUF6896 domain-containing protein n=1 Tax=Burkholderia ubonensis TaxID=101571 RepID=UPI0009B3BBD0|nr:hypothetical protein [Burkholderia ubonensis]
MNNKLARLICDYQESTRTALVLMQRSGIRMPFSSADWIETEIPVHGELEGGVHYFKHGSGCAVKLPTGEVDFDFGKDGEIGGFDEWRLTRFAKNKLEEYGFETEDSLKKHFTEAVIKGSLIRSEDFLYYVANTPRSLAMDVDSRLPGDNLPCRHLDPILVLHSGYFLAADLMRENYEKLNKKLEKNDYLSDGDKIKFRIYLSSWLGFLRTTCEGLQKLRIRILIQENRPARFRELIPKVDALGQMMKQHSDPLRKFRNDTFHLRDNIEATRNFFAKGEERLQWAEDLHFAIDKLFSEYRILCEVHYLINGRTSEISIRKKRTYRRKISKH